MLTATPGRTPGRERSRINRLDDTIHGWINGTIVCITLNQCPLLSVVLNG